MRKDITMRFLIFFCLMMGVCGAGMAAEPVKDIRDATVFVVDEPNSEKGFSRDSVRQVKSHLWIRAWFKWFRTMPYADGPRAVEEAHSVGALFGGGITVSALSPKPVETTGEQFRDLVTYDADGSLYPAYGRKDAGYYHGALENRAYLDYVLMFVYRQIDAGVDALFMDEVHGAYTGHEGYDKYGIAAFREYLIEKFVDGVNKKGWAIDDERWTSEFGIPLGVAPGVPAVCPDGTMKTFDYIEYLKHLGLVKTPTAPENPLVNEWGGASYIAAADPNENYSTVRNDRAWKYIVDKIREYAAEKGRKVYIQANGNNRYVDFQVNPMFYEWSLKDGRMDASVPQIMKWKSTVDYGKSLVDPGVPVVFFHDWGFDIPFKTLSKQDKINWIRIYGAEIYAAGGFFAFPVGGPPGDAGKNGTLEEIIRQTNFYYDHGDLYRNVDGVEVFGTGVTASAPNITTSVARQSGPKRKIVHLINHNYSDGKIIPQKNFIVKVPAKAEPKSIKIVSPDFGGALPPDYSFRGGKLKVRVPSLEAYNVIVIEP